MVNIGQTVSLVYKYIPHILESMLGAENRCASCDVDIIQKYLEICGICVI